MATETIPAELLPCPFCGTPVESRRVGGDRGFTRYEHGTPALSDEAAWKCPAMGWRAVDGQSDVLAAWNRRAARPAIDAETVEACARVCEDQAQTFLSPEYSTGQPLSSIRERFACESCATAIRQLSPASQGDDT